LRISFFEGDINGIVFEYSLVPEDEVSSMQRRWRVFKGYVSPVYMCYFLPSQSSPNYLVPIEGFAIESRTILYE
jgi:hypothetical protein